MPGRAPTGPRRTDIIGSWEALKQLAIFLDLPGVEETTSWGNPVLKANGKLWCWWSPYVDVARFKCDRDTREMVRLADPETFPAHPHYEAHNLILVAAGRIDEGWARARLLQTWKEMAPKRVLRAWEQGAP